MGAADAEADSGKCRSLGALSSSVPLSSTKKRLATLRLSAPSPAHHKGLEKSKGPHGRHALRAIGARRI